MGAAIVALFALNKVLFDTAMRAYREQNEYLRGKNDEKDELIAKLLEATRAAVTTTERVVRDGPR